MQLAEFKNVLARNPDKGLRLVLPNGEPIEAEFHITEVGHVVRRFIDCGGTVREIETCLLQVWVDEGDAAHRLRTGKLAQILDLSRKVVTSETLPVEVEYGCCRVSQYAIESVTTTAEVVTFQLQNKKTDCLARELCGVGPAASGAIGAPATNCCQP